MLADFVPDDHPLREICAWSMKLLGEGWDTHNLKYWSFEAIRSPKALSIFTAIERIEMPPAKGDAPSRATIAPLRLIPAWLPGECPSASADRGIRRVRYVRIMRLSCPYAMWRDIGDCGQFLSGKSELWVSPRLLAMFERTPGVVTDAAQESAAHAALDAVIAAGDIRWSDVGARSGHAAIVPLRDMAGYRGLRSVSVGKF